MEILFC